MNEGGSLSAGGRFDRMETTLGRIEMKLDTKVDHDDFRTLAHRVELLESGETPLGKILLEQFAGMQKQLNELLMHGSQRAQTAGARVGELEKQVAKLERGQEAQDTLIEDRRRREVRAVRFRAFALTTISTLAMVLSVFTAIHN